MKLNVLGMGTLMCANKTPPTPAKKALRTKAVTLIFVVLMPIAVASTFLGVWMVKRLSGAKFYPIVKGLTFLIGLKLIWDGAHGLLKAA